MSAQDSRRIVDFPDVTKIKLSASMACVFLISLGLLHTHIYFYLSPLQPCQKYGILICYRNTAGIQIHDSHVGFRATLHNIATRLHTSKCWIVYLNIGKGYPRSFIFVQAQVQV